MSTTDGDPVPAPDGPGRAGEPASTGGSGSADRAPAATAAPEPLRHADGSARPDPGGPAFWIGLLVGGGVMAFGLGGLLNEAAGTNPPYLVAWAIGFLLVHDLVIAPVTAVLGWILLKVVPHRVRGPVIGGLIVMALTAVVAIPVVYGAGRRPDNPTLLPYDDYPRNLAIVLGVVAVATMALVVWRALRGRRADAPPAPSEA